MNIEHDYGAKQDAAQLSGLNVRLAVIRELFSFHCEQDWVNKAQRRYANCGVRKGYYITLDAQGHVMHMGLCFQTAAYPVTVYELATTWVVTASNTQRRCAKEEA